MASMLVDRWLDVSRPTAGEAARDLALRVLAPALVLFGAIVGIGALILGPLNGLQSEVELNRDLQADRSPLWDTVTMVWSRIGNTEIIIGTCVIAALVIFWRTRQWWWAVIPVIAISVQASVFVAATAVTGRNRPEVEHLDPAPPTSSFPSGHVGASTALYLSFALMAQRIETAWLRRLLTVVCVLVPFLVGFARAYRGMHHVSDIVVGLLNGLVCAVLAWGWLRRDPSRREAP